MIQANGSIAATGGTRRGTTGDVRWPARWTSPVARRRPTARSVVPLVERPTVEHVDPREGENAEDDEQEAGIPSRDAVDQPALPHATQADPRDDRGGRGSGPQACPAGTGACPVRRRRRRRRRPRVAHRQRSADETVTAVAPPRLRRADEPTPGTPIWRRGCPHDGRRSLARPRDARGRPRRRAAVPTRRGPVHSSGRFTPRTDGGVPPPGERRAASPWRRWGNHVGTGGGRSTAAWPRLRRRSPGSRRKRPRPAHRATMT